jgi:hypothetical protein
MLISKRALLWAVSGALIGVVVWSVVGGTLSVFHGSQLRFTEALRAWPMSVLYTALWASFIGLVSIPLYFVAFGVWQLYLRAHPAVDYGEHRRAIAALLLAAPMAIAVTWSFGSSFAGFDWPKAAWIGPLALLSCWSAVWMPRRWFRLLQAPLGDEPSGIGAHAT